MAAALGARTWRMINAGPCLVFATGSDYQCDLWRSDGTAEGTKRFATVRCTGGSFHAAPPPSGTPAQRQAIAPR